MAEIKELVAYLLLNHKQTTVLSNARLTKLIYLCDWKFAIEHNKPMTNIQWYFDNFGPFVWDVIDSAKKYPEIFKIEYQMNSFGGTSRIVRLLESDYQPQLTIEEQETVNHVIQNTQDKTWNGFIQLVYSTYPIVNSKKYELLNLNKLSREYKRSMSYYLEGVS
jgi:hypothetical protein